MDTPDRGAIYAAVVLLSFLSCLTTWIGVVLATRVRRSTKGIASGIGFSVGIMLLISFVELLPEAINSAGAPPALSAAAAGAVLIWVLNLIIPHTHLVEETSRVEASIVRSAYLIMMGLILHDVPEGFAMANSYIVSPSMGVLIALAIALHNIPEEFAMAVPLVPLKKPKVLYGAAVLSALAEPAGAVIGLVAVGLVPALNALFMSFAAGAMIFVSLHELLPMVRRYPHPSLFAAGGAFSLVVYALLNALIPAGL